MSKISLPKDKEKALVERAQKDSSAAAKQAYGALYEHYRPHIYRYLRNKVNETETAEDLTATVFTKALEALGNYRWEGVPFSAWLYRIAHNALVDHYRQRSQTKKVALDRAAPLEASGPSPEEEFYLWEMEDKLKGLVQDLPLREREIITLKFFEGYTNRHIAQLTGLTETNVGTIVYRVVRSMREELNPL